MSEDSIVTSEHVKLEMAESDEKAWESLVVEDSSLEREMWKIAWAFRVNESLAWIPTKEYWTGSAVAGILMSNIVEFVVRFLK